MEYFSALSRNELPSRHIRNLHSYYYMNETSLKGYIPYDFNYITYWKRQKERYSGKKKKTRSIVAKCWTEKGVSRLSTEEF